ncbi:kxDL motif-containing protein 1 isoform X2 [Marmota marmota marmota]|uniref:kxDL motif-containing protein 1 isoform X2 n=1 Tax=Marmota marmota marmota TaxID=9994 RepID=UPI002091E661|nr:kxDL motif-containing protein 1 isoform X2 [Marmota marmota marmota]
MLVPPLSPVCRGRGVSAEWSPAPLGAVEEEEEMDPPDSASRVFCSRILSMVNTDDVNAIILAQKNMLDRFEKTNEMLLNFNNLSSARLQQMSERFLHHTRTLVEMKRDLDSIFRRISFWWTQHLCLYVVLRIKPGPHACQASALPLQPHPQLLCCTLKCPKKI